MKFDITKLDEKDMFVEIPFGNQDEMLKIKRFLNSGDIAWLTMMYVDNYFNGVLMGDGKFMTESIGKDLCSPQIAYRQFLINLTELVTDLELEPESIKAFENYGLFETITDYVVNAYAPLDNAKEIISQELSIGIVVQGALEKILSLIPQDAKIESLTEGVAKAINDISPDRMKFISDMFKKEQV